jgi:GAF domain-containing protein
MNQESNTHPTIETHLAEISSKEFLSLWVAAQAILLHRDFNVSARIIFNEACKMTGATSGYVALLSATGEENEVLFLESGGKPCTVDPELPMPIRGLRAESYFSGKAVYENDFMKSKWIDFMPDGHMVLNNVMFSPLNIEGKTVGIMGLANKESHFTEKDATIATAFGEIAAIALQNSQIMDELKESINKLEQFNEVLVEREMRIIEMKKEVNELCQELGKTTPYPVIWEEE